MALKRVDFEREKKTNIIVFIHIIDNSYVVNRLPYELLKGKINNVVYFYC